MAIAVAAAMLLPMLHALMLDGCGSSHAEGYAAAHGSSSCPLAAPGHTEPASDHAPARPAHDDKTCDLCKTIAMTHSVVVLAVSCVVGIHEPVTHIAYEPTRVVYVAACRKVGDPRGPPSL